LFDWLRKAVLPKPESAYFAIADISGYTSFFAGVELDHAQDIVARLAAAELFSSAAKCRT
jgi:hypothetical protein